MINMSRFWLLVLLTAGTHAPAQESQPRSSYVQSMNERFAQRSPRAGEPLPDASGYTADGQPFALNELRGKLTVLVTGCLT